MLGLYCCTWAFSSCSEWRLLSGCNEWASNCGGFSCYGAWVLSPWASVVVVHGLSCPQTCGILLDQGWNLCPLPDRWSLNQWTTREFHSLLSICSKTPTLQTFLWDGTEWAFFLIWHNFHLLNHRPFSSSLQDTPPPPPLPEHSFLVQIWVDCSSRLIEQLWSEISVLCHYY